jgi:hypothetical protein
VVAAGDESYRWLDALRRGGLLSGAARRGATRYEMALETGRAALALAAKRTAKTPVDKRATDALSRLLSSLRAELRRLDVDVDAALALCRAGNGAGANSGLGQDAPAVLISPPNTKEPDRAGLGTAPSAGRSSATATNLRSSNTTLSLSQRLRVSAALSSLARDAGDPFGDAAVRRVGLGASTSGGSIRARSADFEPVRSGLRASALRDIAAGATYDVTDWLRVRAAYAALAPSSQPTGLRALEGSSTTTALLSPGALGVLGAGQSVGGGVDVDLLGLTLSGDVARIGLRNPAGAARASDLWSTGGTRFAGGARVSAFDNRLGLSVNLSRLVPEDTSMLSQSAAGLNLDIGGDRLRLKLLYQQLFGTSARGQADRVIAGGVNISF